MSSKYPHARSGLDRIVSSLLDEFGRVSDDAARFQKLLDQAHEQMVKLEEDNALWRSRVDYLERENKRLRGTS